MPQVINDKVFIQELNQLDPNVIFEFGSFDGKDALDYKRMFPGSILYCFEADPIRFKIVKEHVKDCGIYCYNKAISDITGFITFYPTLLKGTDVSGVAGSLLKHTQRHKQLQENFQDFPNRAIQVPSITIKDFCKENNITNIDFMHMDVEGAIQQVVDGFGGIRPKLILAEVVGRDNNFEGANSLDKNNKLFTGLGYSIVKRLPDANVLYKKES